MSSFVRRSIVAAGAVFTAAGAASALMLGTAGAASAGEPCSGSSYCVKPTPEFDRAATECLPPAAIGAAGGGYLAGPPGALVGAGTGAANCAYGKATD